MAAPTLAWELRGHAVDMAQLHKDYKPMLRLVRELIGVVPNCDPYLEIWPAGFRTYNLLVPNLLNLPASLMGKGAPKDLVGLAMYVSSRAAECMYCSAHACSFALRRGASRDAVIGEYTPVEEAVATLAHALGSIPTEMTSAYIDELDRYLEPGDVEWVVMSVALMGFLNKFMDAMGIPLESEAINDVSELIEPTGWSIGKHLWDDVYGERSNGNGRAHGNSQANGASSIPVDGMGTYLRVLRQAPGAIRLESSWTKGVSGRIGPALLMLEDRVGYAFPILATLQHKRAVKAIAAVLRENLDPNLTKVGLPAKCMVGLVFAKVVDDEMLMSEMIQLAQLLAPEIDPRIMVDVGKYAVYPPEYAEIPRGLSSREAAAIILAKAGSTSPSSINEITISTVLEHLTPAQIVETVVWLSVLQMLHRLYAYYDARIGLI
jgi:alkylhydroperoxidase family enzyme